MMRLKCVVFDSLIENLGNAADYAHEILVDDLKNNGEYFIQLQFENITEQQLDDFSEKLKAVFAGLNDSVSHNFYKQNYKREQNQQFEIQFKRKDHRDNVLRIIEEMRLMMQTPAIYNPVWQPAW